MNKRNFKPLLVLVPFAVIVWLIGWSLYTIGSIIVEGKRQFSR